MSLINIKTVKRAKMLSTMRLFLCIGVSIIFSCAAFDKKSVNSRPALITVFAISLLFLFRAIVKYTTVKRIFRFDSALSLFKSNEIMISDLSGIMGFRPKRTLRMVKKYFKKQYFKNCYLDIFAEPKIVIRISEVEPEVDVVCPNCGTECRITSGTTVRCPSCSAVISL